MKALERLLPTRGTSEPGQYEKNSNCQGSLYSGWPLRCAQH